MSDFTFAIDDDWCYGEMSWFWDVWNASVILVHVGKSVSNCELETAILWRVWQKCTQYSVTEVRNCKKYNLKNQRTWFDRVMFY